MLPVFASILLFAAGSTVIEKQFGAWRAVEGCAHDADNFGCSRTLSPSNPNLDITLIFRNSFVIRATVKNCHQEATRVSFAPDAKEWRRLTLAGRIDRTKRVLSQWAETSAIGCSSPAALSFDGFENGFAYLDAAASADGAAPST